jgi:hypothetical protein
MDLKMTAQANDDSASTARNTPATINVLANDTVNGQPATLGNLSGLPIITTPPAQGTAIANPDGSITYTPNNNFVGTDEFYYSIEEGSGMARLTGTVAAGTLRVMGFPIGTVVDWGDGTTTVISGPNVNQSYSHAYAGPATFNVTSAGTAAGVDIYIGGTALLTITDWSLISTWSGVPGMRMGLSVGDSENLTAVPASLPANITSLQDCFQRCYVFNQDITMWDTSNITSMNYMFANARSFNQPIGVWNVSSLIGISHMFDWALVFNQPLNNWDVSNVVYAGYAFFRCPFNQPLNNWDTSSLEDAQGMFDFSSFNQDIGMWDTSALVNAAGMFRANTVFNQDLSGWCVTNIPTAPYQFDQSANSWVLPRPVWGTCPP